MIEKNQMKIDESRFYKLICAISKLEFDNSSIDNILLSEICLKYDMENIYNRVNYLKDSDNKIIGINFNTSLFVGASMQTIALCEEYRKSITLILLDDNQCKEVIGSIDNMYIYNIAYKIANELNERMLADKQEKEKSRSK